MHWKRNMHVHQFYINSLLNQHIRKSSKNHQKIDMCKYKYKYIATDKDPQRGLLTSEVGRRPTGRVKLTLGHPANQASELGHSLV